MLTLVLCGSAPVILPWQLNSQAWHMSLPADHNIHQKKKRKSKNMIYFFAGHLDAACWKDCVTYQTEVTLDIHSANLVPLLWLHNFEWLMKAARQMFSFIRYVVPVHPLVNRLNYVSGCLTCSCFSLLCYRLNTCHCQWLKDTPTDARLWCCARTVCMVFFFWRSKVHLRCANISFEKKTWCHQYTATSRPSELGGGR